MKEHQHLLISIGLAQRGPNIRVCIHNIPYQFSKRIDLPGGRDMGNLGMRADISPRVRCVRADRRRALWLRMLNNPGFLNSTRKMTRSRRVASLHKY